MSGDTQIEPDLNGVPNWYREIFPAGPRTGFYQNLGRHAVTFVDRGADQLVVSFDNLAEAGGRHHAREPWAGKFCADNGWSHLGVFAQPPIWFRDAELIEYLEKLKEDGFFDRFQRVAFCGTSMGGFGAMAFSSLAPGATVVAFSPQSSLHGDLTPWETRFAKGRAADWSLPYSDAAEHVAEAERVYLVYDPFIRLDQRHAARFSGNNILPLHAIGLGHKSALTLRRMDQLKPVMRGAITGNLTEGEFYTRIRGRKDIYLYRTNIEEQLAERGMENWIPMFREAFKSRRRQKKRAGGGA